MRKDKQKMERRGEQQSMFNVLAAERGKGAAQKACKCWMRSIHGTVTHWSCPGTCEGKCFTHSLSHTRARFTIQVGTLIEKTLSILIYFTTGYQNPDVDLKP